MEEQQEEEKAMPYSWEHYNSLTYHITVQYYSGARTTISRFQVPSWTER